MTARRLHIVLLALAVLSAAACQARTPRNIVYFDCIHADTLHVARFGRSRAIDSALRANGRGAIIIRMPDVGDGRSLASALVALRRDAAQDSSAVAWGSTDSLGVIALASVPAGAYVLSVKQIGYTAFQQPVTVRPGTVDTVHLRARLAACRQQQTLGRFDGHR